eukprot:5541134-Lingulodinium_polyedra.AAC.1
MPKGRTFSAETRALMFGTPAPEGSAALPPDEETARQFHEWVTGGGSPTILGSSSPSTTFPEAEEE